MTTFKFEVVARMLYTVYRKQSCFCLFSTHNKVD